MSFNTIIELENRNGAHSFPTTKVGSQYFVNIRNAAQIVFGSTKLDDVFRLLEDLSLYKGKYGFRVVRNGQVEYWSQDTVGEMKFRAIAMDNPQALFNGVFVPATFVVAVDDKKERFRAIVRETMFGAQTGIATISTKLIKNKADLRYLTLAINRYRLEILIEAKRITVFDLKNYSRWYNRETKQHELVPAGSRTTYVGEYAAA